MNIKRDKPEVGQTVYSLNVGSAARYSQQKLAEYTVTKVGRKYFTIKREDSWVDHQFHLDTWKQKTEYSPDMQLYTSIQEYEDEKERNDLLDKMFALFYARHLRINLSLEQLREIDKIVESRNEKG